jgi:hypothetical protein
MESRGPAEPTDLRDLDIGALRRAVGIYLQIAYDDSTPSEAVRHRLEWPEGVDAETLMSGPPFERSGKSKSTGATIYALRLGNARYPHMKLQVQPWPNSAGFMLSVNTHDQVLTLDASTVDLPAFREIQSENKRLKELIEQAWDSAGLPTFLRYLREYIEQRGGHVEPDSLPVPPGD